jgi:glycosyltransferase involved in cell wall biosynthesis
MKILVFSQYFWPESFRINEVVESLIDVGCEVTVLTGQPNYPHGKTFEGYRALQVSTETHPRGYVIHRVPLLPRGKSNTLGLIFNYLSFVVSSAIVGPFVLRGQKFDLIFVCGMSPFTQSVSAIWLGKLKSAKVVIWVQDLWPESLEASGFVKNKTVLLSVAAVVSWIYRSCDLLLVQSKGFRSSVEKMSGATPIEYHPNPGELAFNQHTSHEQAPSVALGKGFNVVFAGNMGTVQALDKVLDAAEMLLEHNAINIVLIGSGSLTTWIETEIKRRNLTNVTMPGRFPVEAMPGILAQASALLVSLCRDPIISKTIPSKVQVYLAAGKPIIASLDGEGAAVVEESGAGVSCPAEDAAALAQGILKLYGLSPQQLELLGKQGVAYYQEHFEPNMLATRLRDHFATVLSNRARSATEDAAN